MAKTSTAKTWIAKTLIAKTSVARTSIAKASITTAERGLFLKRWMAFEKVNGRHFDDTDHGRLIYTAPITLA